MSPIQQLQEAAGLFQRGQWRDAAAICRALLANGHALFDIFHLYGLSLFQLRQFDQAEEYLQRAVDRQPDNAQARNSFGSVYFALNIWRSAEQQFKHAIQLNKTYWEPYQNLINTYFAQNKFDQVELLLEEAKGVFGESLQILRLSARLWRHTGEYQRSLEMLDKIIEQNQEDFDAINDKGVTLNLLGQFDLSVSYFENIVKCAPEYVAAHINLGFAHYKLGQYTEAKRVFAKGLDMLEDKDNLIVTQQLQRNNEDRNVLIAKINFLLSTIELLLGNYQNGWRYYTNRPSILLHRKLIAPKLPIDLNGKSILLINDQGFGDEIFFMRFSRLLKSRGAFVHYVATSMTEAIFEDHPDIDAISLQAPEGKFDYQVSVGDLPYALDIDVESKIPPPIKFIANPELTSKYQSILDGLPKPWVGITWRAGLGNTIPHFGVENPDKHIDLSHFSKLFKDFKGTLIILQRLPKNEEITQLSDSLSCKLVDLNEVNNDLLEASAVLSLLDDYVGVSNTNIHIRGSLGLGAKVLIPFPPEWRWLAEGDTSPWYELFKVYRQSPQHDWQQATNQLRLDINGIA